MFHVRMVVSVLQETSVDARQDSLVAAVKMVHYIITFQKLGNLKQ